MTASKSDLIVTTTDGVPGREQAYDRIIADALGMGADAIVAVRMETSTIQQAAREVVFYGTAVRLK